MKGNFYFLTSLFGKRYPESQRNRQDGHPSPLREAQMIGNDPEHVDMPRVLVAGGTRMKPSKSASEKRAETSGVDSWLALIDFFL
jgi:hypothetical protein